MSARHEDYQDRLGDLMDGSLPPAEAGEVWRHVAECEACRDELEFARTLRARARALPREIPPSRDLWAGIAERIGDGGGGARVIELAPRRPQPRAWSRWGSLAAAAVVLVALSSAITARMLRSPGAAPVAVSEGERTTSALVALRPVEREYAQTTEALRAELEARRASLDPETVATIEENLRIIDRAIAESRAALEADPSNPDLPLHLAGIYRRKVELLEEAVRLPART